MKIAPLLITALLVSCAAFTSNPSISEVVAKLDPQTGDMCSNDGKYCYLVTFKSPEEIEKMFPGRWKTDSDGEHMAKLKNITIHFKKASGIFANVDAMSVSAYDNSLSRGDATMRLLEELEEINSGKSY